MRICVTGAGGRVGATTVAELREHGHSVVPVDVAPVVEDLTNRVLIGADLRDAADALDVLKGCDAVVHLANIPAPGLWPAARTYNENSAMNFNVFHAAVELGLQRVVWASSETTLGLPFTTPPRYLPVDEDHYPLPTSTYALSKVAGEAIAHQMAEWAQIAFVALRFSNVFLPSDYALMPSFWPDPRLRSWNLWGYIDVRDAAAACRLAVERDGLTGAPAFVIAAADTVMDRPSRALAAEVFPGVSIRDGLGEFETLLCIDRAGEDLGWTPQHSWRDHVTADGSPTR